MSGRASTSQRGRRRSFERPGPKRILLKVGSDIRRISTTNHGLAFNDERFGAIRPPGGPQRMRPCGNIRTQFRSAANARYLDAAGHRLSLFDADQSAA
jgi:hypothetical protein